MATEPMLEASVLTKSFGGVVACREVSLSIRDGEAVGIIGPNGAGKTTLFDCLTGAYGLDAGQVTFQGRRIDGLRVDRTVRLGLARTFQTMRLFSRMTARENVMVGAFTRTASRSHASRRALDMLSYVDLGHKSEAFAAQLSTGQRKRLELARALATEPRMLLMDEVTAGVDPSAVSGLLALVERLQREGMTLIVVEHNMRVLRAICPRLIAMEMGQVIADGPTLEVIQDENVIRAYLGKAYVKGN